MATPSGGKDDSTETWIAVGVLFALVAAVVWTLHGQTVVELLMRWKYLELRLVAFTSHDAQRLADWIGQRDMRRFTLSTVGELSTYVGTILRWPILAMCVVGAYILRRRSVVLTYSREFDMMSLAREQAKVWPAIQPVVDLDLSSSHRDDGPWASPRSPQSFSELHGLIHDGVFDDVRARETFTKQLGPAWANVDALPPYARQLLAAFAIQADGERDACQTMLGEMSQAYASRKWPWYARRFLAARQRRLREDLDRRALRIVKHANSERVRTWSTQHAYVLTLMCTALEDARRCGVLAPATFLWLKPIDRVMWYALQNVGRRTCFSEAAAVSAHWVAEKAVRRAMFTPDVDRAVAALHQALIDEGVISGDT